MPSIIDIEGIGPIFKKKLKAIGVSSTEKLLELGGTPKGRKNLAEKTGIGDALILEWVNLSDLFRIKGVGSEYSDLLEEAGVDTVVELSKRVPKNLFDKMVEINTAKKLVRKMPVEKQVAAWVDQAKKLPRLVSY
jgi:predicted flap endonuclease-1-like 5' DNA nuclease